MKNTMIKQILLENEIKNKDEMLFDMLQESSMENIDLEGIIAYYDKDYKKSLEILEKLERDDIVRLFLCSDYFILKDYDSFKENILGFEDGSDYFNKIILRAYIDILGNNVGNNEVAEEYINIITNNKEISILNDSITKINMERLKKFLEINREFLLGRILLVNELIIKGKLEKGLLEVEDILKTLENREYLKKNFYIAELYMIKLNILDKMRKYDELEDCFNIIESLECADSWICKLPNDRRKKIMNKKLKRRRLLLTSVFSIERLNYNKEYESIVRVVDNLNLKNWEIVEFEYIILNYLRALSNLGKDDKVRELLNIYSKIFLKDKYKKLIDRSQLNI